jgi:hypothetical protein
MNLVTAAATSRLAAIGAGRAFAVALEVQLFLFDLAVTQSHFGVIEPAFLVFFNRLAGRKAVRCNSSKRQHVPCSFFHVYSLSESEIGGRIDLVIVVDHDRFHIFQLIDHIDPGPDTHDHDRRCDRIGKLGVWAKDSDAFNPRDR